MVHRAEKNTSKISPLLTISSYINVLEFRNPPFDTVQMQGYERSTSCRLLWPAKIVLAYTVLCDVSKALSERKRCHKVLFEVWQECRPVLSTHVCPEREIRPSASAYIRR